MPQRRIPLTLARKSAGFTQEEMAHRLGVDVSTVKRWEGGYNAPSPWMWPKLAKLLGLTRAELVGALVTESTGSDPGSRDRAGTPEIVPLSLKGLREVVLGGVRGHACETQSVQSAALTAHRLYQRAEYDGAAKQLTRLLAQPSSLLHDAPTVAVAYLAAAKLATKVGDAVLASVTADRAVRAALESGHSSLVGASRYQVACALLQAGRVAEARETAGNAVDPAASDTPEALSVQGALVLLLAILASRDGERAAAKHHLRSAGELAERVRRDANWLWTGFGPTNVMIHELTVWNGFGEADRVLELGARVDADRLPRILQGRRSQVHLELAAAASGSRNDGLAMLHLLEAERVATQTISRNAVARTILATLLGRERKGAAPGLRALADRAGVLG